MTNKQRRFLKKLNKKKSMSYDYLDIHYPNLVYDKELGAASFQQYIDSLPNRTGITISVKGIEELQDFHRYLRHWRIPVILSIVSISITLLSLLLSVLRL